MSASQPSAVSLPGHAIAEVADSSQRASEPQVWGRTQGSRERWVRLLNYTPETREYGAGWEIGLALDIDGQWRMSWLADGEILEIEIRA